MKNFHYYGSTAFTWAVGQTREEVLRALAKDAGKDLIQNNVRKNGGLYVWTCRVDLPQDSVYSIRNFHPVEVPIDPSTIHEYNIQSVKGTVYPIDKEPKSE